jgi:hypothetical protein
VQWDEEVITAFRRARLRIHAIQQRGIGESLHFALEGVLERQDQSKKSSREQP